MHRHRGLEVADPGLAFTAAMRQTVQALGAAGHSAVCVVLDVPQLKYPAMHALLIAHRRGIPDGFLAVTRADALAPVRQMEGEVRALAQTGMLRFADPKSALCPGPTCLYEAAGRALYFDEDHLSAAGAAYSAQALEACFRPPDGAPLTDARARRGALGAISQRCAKGVPAMPKCSTPAGHGVAKSLAGKGVWGRDEPRLSHPLSSGSFRGFVCGFGARGPVGFEGLN